MVPSLAKLKEMIAQKDLSDSRRLAFSEAESADKHFFQYCRFIDSLKLISVSNSTGK